MENFIEALRLEDLPPGRGTSVTVAGKAVAFFNVDGTIYAMEDACLHHGLSLGTSELRGNVVTCRGHGWRYNVTTGNTLHVPDYGVASYPVKVVDGTIMVAMGSSDAGQSSSA
jgi:nitrite reductase/ring-hydroxylating ferredoxin subunit